MVILYRTLLRLNQPQLHLFKSRLATQFTRFLSSKQESYFSAIGGESDDPPPDLTPQQVTSILRENEMTIANSVKSIKLIECNQLGSNTPIEDRLRIVRFRFDDDDKPQNETIALAVFDGHGGGACADAISQRLFHYIALSLSTNTKKLNNTDYIESVIEDLYVRPDPNVTNTTVYNDRALDFVRKAMKSEKENALVKFASDLLKPSDEGNSSIPKKLLNCFQRCDDDLALEIERNLLNSPSNVLLHHYLSLAVSGCCVTLLLIHQNTAYIASSGDCRAVMGLHATSGDLSPDSVNLKTIELSKEHNSDNLNELKRIANSHPKSEQYRVIRNNRLLGQLMPLRAFGDFNYKWDVEKIKKLGLTRAFGSHVIPPYYQTPPYLIVEPEITEVPLDDIYRFEEKYIVLATDGLWEQFENHRKVILDVFKHQCKRRFMPIETDDIDMYDEIDIPEKVDLKEENALEPEVPTNATVDHLIIDQNGATNLIRTALGTSPTPTDPHLERLSPLDIEKEKDLQHARLVTFLTLPKSVVRNFRDDISLIIVHLV